jgi:predicted transcriptional regulator
MESEIIKSLGNDVLLAWDILKEKYPELQQLHVNSKTINENSTLNATGGYFEDPSGFDKKISITVVTGNNNIDHYRELLNSRNTSANVVAKLLEISPESLTPEILRLFIFLHEVGHAYDYITNYKNGVDGSNMWKQKSQEEINSLPIPGISPPMLKLYIDHDNSKLPERAQQMIREGKANEIMQLQEEAYRRLPKETFADEFSANSIKNFLPTIIYPQT